MSNVSLIPAFLLTFYLFLLQVFKFAVYLGIPIALTAFVVYRTDNLQQIIENVSPGAAMGAPAPQFRRCHAT